MSNATQRSIVRWIHIVLGIPIIGYIYSPFDQIPNYAPATRFVFVPVLVLSGLWMWKGHVVRRLFSKGSPQPDAAGKGLPLAEGAQLNTTSSVFADKTARSRARFGSAGSEP
jgi:hypothetical protein